MVVLAAGLSRRFGGDKLSAALNDGRPVGAATLDVARRACPRVLCVVRPDSPVQALAAGCSGVQVVTCPQAVDGMAFSLAAGVAAAPRAAGWVVMLGDMPWVQPSTVRAVVAAIAAGADIAIPVHEGQRGHPVGFASRFLPQLRALSGDAGARSLLAQWPEAITEVLVSDPGVLRDIDRREDLRPD